MRTKDVFKMIKGCPAGKSFSFKHNKCVTKDKMVCNVGESEVMKKHPERSAIDWECDDVILGNGYDLWKGTANDFMRSEMNPWFKFTNQPVNLHYTIGGDILFERKNPGLWGDYRSPPWCIPAGEACFNRERLYEITEEIKGIPIIDKKRQRLNESLFGKKVNLRAWISVHPEYYGMLRIDGVNGVFYLLAPQHVYGGPVREEMLSYLAAEGKYKRLPRHPPYDEVF